MSAFQINEHLIQLVKNERKITGEILQNILLFQKCSGFVKLGYPSMMSYLTRHLGYSDDQAYRRLKAAQLLDEVPKAAAQIQNGTLNLSQAAQTQKALEAAQKEKREIPQEKKEALIAAIANQNNFETQKVLSENLGLPPKENDRIRPQSNGTVRLEAQLTQAQHEKLRKIKSLLSHQCPDQKIGDILETLFDFYLSKKSPERATRSTKNGREDLKKQDKTAQCFMETKKQSIKRSEPTCSRYISVQIKKSVWERSSGRCEHVSPEGVRCGSEYQLQYDHIKPLAHGGITEACNLRMLCRVHNLSEASKMGIGYETTSHLRRAQDRPGFLTDEGAVVMTDSLGN